MAALPRQVRLLASYITVLSLISLLYCIQWILNVCYTVLGNGFSDFVREKINERNETLVDRQDLNIAIDPTILDVIMNSSSIAVSKGAAQNSLKIGSKRRRTRAEIDEYRAQQENQFNLIIEKDA